MPNHHAIVNTCVGLFLQLCICSVSFAQSGTPLPVSNSKPFVLGVVDEIPSTILGESRILNIYLPEGYNANDTVHYAVAYLLDGAADEDFIHVVGLYQSNSFEWVKRVPKTIVVGIANVNRMRDFTFPTTIAADLKAYPKSGGSAKFISFIEHELQPYINKKYKTNKDATLIGQSLAGLLVTEILCTKPAMFNRYVIVSPSLWWNDGSLITTAALLGKQTIQPGTRIYIGVGKEGLATDTHVMEVDANLLAEKLKSNKHPNLSIYFDYLPQETHATIMHQAVFNALRALHPEKELKSKMKGN